MTDTRFRFIFDAPDFTGMVLPDGAPEDIEDAAPTTRVQIAKTGSFVHPIYGRFKVTKDTFDSFIRNFRASVPTDELPVDFDHEPDYGGSTEANGWIKGIEADGNKLYAVVEWNWRGVFAIKEKLYKYVSPTWVMNYVSDDGTRRGPVLLAFALTNRPFFEGMASVSFSRTLDADQFAFAEEVADDAPDPSDSRPAMTDFAKFAKVFGLAEDTSEEAILAKAEEIVTASAVSLEDRASAEGKVLVTVEEHTQLTASKTAVDVLQADVKKLQDEAAETSFETAFSGALTDKAGARVAPAEKETLRSLFDAIGAEKFSEYLASRTVIVNTTAAGSGEGDEDGEVPAGVDAESFALHQKVTKFMREHEGTSYSDALTAVQRSA